MKYLTILVLVMLLFVSVANAADPFPTPPPMPPVRVAEPVMPKGDYKLVLRDGQWKWVGKPERAEQPGNPWRWTDEEGGYWWRNKTVKAVTNCPCSPACTCGCAETGVCNCNTPRAVRSLVMPQIQTGNPVVQFGSPIQGYSLPAQFAPQYQPSFRQSYAPAAQCVGGDCSR